MTGVARRPRRTDRAVTELTDWLDAPLPSRFPFPPVIAEFHRVGKHFVSDELLKSLALARERLAPDEHPGPERVLLEQFLDTALDKWDERYDYPSYTALGVLGLPDADACRPLADARERRDRLVVQLLADELRFELAAAEGRTSRFPELRPEPRLVTKRYRLALRVASPALRRLGLAGRLTADDPAEAARQLWDLVEAGLSGQERQVLRLSMLPVYVSHDEHLFIRVLQSFEATFAMLAPHIRAAIEALNSGDPDAAVSRLDVAASALTESAPLFSLLATMQAESFYAFREFTEGASAIQSRNYKLVESLCRTPDRDRLDSSAYLSTPEVRTLALAGQQTLDEACSRALADEQIPDGDRERITTAMHGFASALRRWRQTHYRLAVRMLGERSGTGYTEGTPYLSAVRKIPVFRSIDEAA